MQVYALHQLLARMEVEGDWVFQRLTASQRKAVLELTDQVNRHENLPQERLRLHRAYLLPGRCSRPDPRQPGQVPAAQQAHGTKHDRRPVDQSAKADRATFSG